jgi:hypothetical protein
VGGRLYVLDYIGMVGGAALAVSTFLPWYGTDPDNRFARIDGHRGTVTCWDVHPIVGVLLLLAATAPFVLAYVVVKDIQLSWVRGEMTAVISIFAMGLVFFNGAVSRPGTPSSAISLQTGWFLAVVASLLMFYASARRLVSRPAPRKPPGTV